MDTCAWRFWHVSAYSRMRILAHLGTSSWPSLFTILTKDDPPASTMSTQLVLTNLFLASAEPFSFYVWVGLLMLIPLVYVGLIARAILPNRLANAGHAANDLLAKPEKEPPKSIFKRLFSVWTVTWFFNLYCSFTRSLQLQSSKVIIQYWHRHHRILVLTSNY